MEKVFVWHWRIWPPHRELLRLYKMATSQALGWTGDEKDLVHRPAVHERLRRRAGVEVARNSTLTTQSRSLACPPLICGVVSRGVTSYGYILIET